MKKFTKYNLEQYNKAIESRKGGLGSQRISKIINVPRTTIDGWIYKDRKPYDFSEKRIAACNSKENVERMRAMNKITQPKAVKISAELRTKRLPESAKKISRELGYILGVIYGDGHVSVKQRRVILAATDKDFVLEFKRNIEKWSKFKARLYTRELKKTHYIKARKIQWVSYIDSKEASEFLYNFNQNSIVEESDKIKCIFLRGFYDSDGCAYKNFRGIIGYNTDYNLILLVKKLLNSLNIYPTISKSKINKIGPYNCKEFIYKLCIYKKENIKKFYELIGFSIRRKQERLQRQVEIIQNKTHRK